LQYSEPASHICASSAGARYDAKQDELNYLIVNHEEVTSTKIPHTRFKVQMLILSVRSDA